MNGTIKYVWYTASYQRLGWVETSHPYDMAIFYQLLESEEQWPTHQHDEQVLVGQDGVPYYLSNCL